MSDTKFIGKCTECGKSTTYTSDLITNWECHACGKKWTAVNPKLLDAVSPQGNVGKITESDNWIVKITLEKLIEEVKKIGLTPIGHCENCQEYYRYEHMNLCSRYCEKILRWVTKDFGCIHWKENE